jgi:hypothetical protein
MIPEFDENGNLPSGIHKPTTLEFMSRFVENFDTSKTRKDIFDGYKSYCGDLLQFDIATTQWVDGSFTTSKIDPNDIDIVTHLDAIKITSKQMVDKIGKLFQNRNHLKSKYKCDAYAIPIYPPNHLLYNETVKWLDYWRNCFGKDRNKKTKGLIEFELDERTFRF